MKKEAAQNLQLFNIDSKTNKINTDNEKWRQEIIIGTWKSKL
jgi:hypothetical protein